MTMGVWSVVARSRRTGNVRIPASILDSVCNPFLQSTLLTMGCQLYCTEGLFGEVHGNLELLAFKWTVLPEAAWLESVAARPRYNLCLSTHSNAVALLGHAIGAAVCIKPSEALGKIFCV